MTMTLILVVRKYGIFSKIHRLSYHLNLSRKVVLLNDSLGLIFRRYNKKSFPADRSGVLTKTPATSV